MPVDTARVLSFLNNVHLFHNLNLSEGQLAELSGLFTETPLAENDTLFYAGDAADSFYLILEGKVNLAWNTGRKVEISTQLGEGDYFGEEALIGRSHRLETATAAADCTLLRMSCSQFQTLLQNYPEVKTNLRATVSNRRLARKKRWKWLNPDEILYILTRKHPYFLVTSLALPVIFLAAGLLLFSFLYFGFAPLKDTSLVAIVGSIWCAGALLWGGWVIWDWSNDYYFVTNQRVIWLERVAGIYESRQESPLGTILSVGVDSDQVGRMIGYGDVIVRTFTGSILLSRVKSPKVVASIIDEKLGRTRIVLEKEEAGAMEKAIRAKLGMAPPGDAQPKETSGAPQQGISRTVNPGAVQRLLAYLFQVRLDGGEVVTYRKHWFVLLRAIWKQMILGALIAAGLAGRLLNLITFISLEATIILAGFSLVIVFLWWFYDVIDWHNDIYQVTADQIIDIDRKPFGTERKKSAPLENILSIEYKRLGILGLLFNFGTVDIKIGNSTFAFEYVFNPSRVQQDIFRRKLDKEARRKRAEREAERERLSSWIATYHRYNSELPPIGDAKLTELMDKVKRDAAGEADEEKEAGEEDRDGFGWIE